MADVVLVIAPEMFRDEEYAVPKRVLEERGASTVTASRAPGEAYGKLGMVAPVDISVAEAAESAWDAVIFVGGGGAEVYFDDPSAHALARSVLANGGIVGAICIAPSILAHAGLLDGVAATAFPTQEGDLRAYGALWTGEDVTESLPIVTANGPEAAALFGEAIARALEA